MYSIAMCGALDLEDSLGKPIRSRNMAESFQLPFLDYCEQVIVFSYFVFDLAADLLMYMFRYEMPSILRQ